MWLKFNVADDTHESNYFTVQNDNEAVNNKTVTHVGADEKRPYQVMVAVWSSTPYYYVFHSSDCTIEARRADGNPVNLKSLVREGYLYGGYYKNYQDLAASDDVFNASFQAVYDTNKVSTVSSAKPYDGSALSVNDSRFWKKDNAYKSTDSADPGTALHPQGSAVYFLKEVPDYYLPNRVAYSVDNDNGKQIVQIYLLTAVDDNLYSDIGFFNGDYHVSKMSLSNTFTVTSKVDGEYQSFIISADQLNDEIKRGYIAMTPVTSIPDFTIEANKEFDITPTWTTLDGVEVVNEKLNYIINETNTVISWDGYVRTQLYVNVAGCTNLQDGWDGAEAETWGWFFGGSLTESVAVQFTQVSGSIYGCTIPEGAAGLNLVRCNPNASGTIWDRKWDQTGNITLPDNQTLDYIAKFSANTEAEWVLPDWQTYRGN